jgi:hypothetical protein
MRIDPNTFEKMVNEYAMLKNQTIRKSVIDAIFERVKYYEYDDVKTGITRMTDNTDDKITDSLILKHVRIAKQARLSQSNEQTSSWNGTACDWCDQGRIYYLKQRNMGVYTFVCRCPKCDSVNEPYVPFLSSDEFSTLIEFDRYMPKNTYAKWQQYYGHNQEIPF